MEAATATISFKNGKSLNEEASIMVGPDGTAWVWFTTIAVDYFSHIAAQEATAVAVSGALAGGRRFEANECYIENVDMHGKEGTARHDATGWQVDLANPPEFVVLLMVAGGLRVFAGDPIEGGCTVEYTLLNAVFDGTEKTEYDGRKSFRVDTFPVKTAARQWTLRSHRDFNKEGKAALDMGTVDFLPTATLSARLVNMDSAADADEEAHVVCRLLSLATGAATSWTARHVHDDKGNEWHYAGYRPSTGVRNRSHYELVSNHRPPRGLQKLLTQCTDTYANVRQKYGLDRAIGFLEQARVQKVMDVELVLAILALETLTYYWCLADGVTPVQMKKMNIEEKINRMAKSFQGIDRKGLKTNLLRTDVRNPLMHTGEIPAMTAKEMVSWGDRLYVLAFRIIVTLVGYDGLFGDPTASQAEAGASLA